MTPAFHWLAGVAILLTGPAAAAQPGPAQAEPAQADPAPADPAGIYITEIMETASGLELAADGRFRWMFTAGALDLSAEGRWRRDGNDILLTTEPPVTPPRFELLGSAAEGESALVVQVEDGRGQVPQYLDVQAEYDGGERGYARLDGAAYRFEAEAGRRIVAIRMGSGGFGFWSDRYPVPAGANRMRFRFFPGDLGRADFRDTRVTVEGDTLTLPVLGQPTRYRLLSAVEADAAARMGEPAAIAESTDTILPDGDPVEIAIGARVSPALDRASEEHGNGLIIGIRPFELNFRIGERVLNVGRIGGAIHLPFAVRAPRPGRTVETLFFGYQDRLLTVEEALTRARGLEQWLGAAGFARPVAAASARPEPFVATEHARSGDAAFTASNAVVRAGGWDDAARLLADEAAGVSTMFLFSLKAGKIHADAYLQNIRRRPPEFGGPSGLDFGGGREWVLNVEIQRVPETAEQEEP